MCPLASFVVHRLRAMCRAHCRIRRMDQVMFGTVMFSVLYTMPPAGLPVTAQPPRTRPVARSVTIVDVSVNAMGRAVMCGKIVILRGKFAWGRG